MRQASADLAVRTSGPGLYEVTREVTAWAADQGIEEGLLTVFIRHTSASLTIQENADPDVLRDLETWLARAVPDGDPAFRHRAEGPDDMPAHVRSALTATSVSVPVANGDLDLGTWQGLFLYEHRHRAHRRRVTVNLLG